MRTRTGGVGAVLLLASGLVAGAAATETPPAFGDSPDVIDITGNFVGDDHAEVLRYHPGPTDDPMLAFSRAGGVGSDLSITTLDEYTVDGLYDPVAGDFDGDGYDEVLWYVPGPAQDFTWDFQPDGQAVSRPYTANGYYWPVAGDLTGDVVDDVLWYAPGPRQDYLWDYNGPGQYTSTARTISGDYVPLVGSFGTDDTDDVLWYAPGPGADYLWDYRPSGAYASTPYPARGYYEPFVFDAEGDGWRGSDIFWYAPGPAPDYIWDYTDGAKVSFEQPADGDYVPTTGDFFGDGHEDVLWMGGTSPEGMWDFVALESGEVGYWEYLWGAGTVAEAVPHELPMASAA